MPTNLDPYAFPKSMGLSFVVCSQSKPVIDFCATWARYNLESGQWRRKPDKFIEHDVDVAEPKRNIWSPASGVQLVLRTKKESENSWHVSIFMINNTKVKSKFLDTSELIFQPQIRVHFHDGVTSLPVDKRRFSEDEEGQLELLYGKLQCLARGYMCGASWQEIDPERPFKGSAEGSPFLPDDIKLLPPDERKLFSNPSVRTEFLPTYTVTQTTVEAQGISGWKKDETDAFRLSETWNFDALSRPLNDIANEYEKWIKNQEGAAAGLDPASDIILRSQISAIAELR